MRVPLWASRLLLVLGVAAVLALTAVLVVHFRQSNGPSAGSDVAVSIPASGGISLSAEAISPAGSGPFPLVVMPASWGSPAREYRTVGAAFAAAGFEVVAYAQRGFQGSGGSVDLAGPQTQRDASTVIDWALKNTHADPSRIGMFGVSYGGGISLLAAAHDPRIKAVVATSAWTDLAGALVPQDTPNAQGLGWMFQSPRVVAALDPQLRQVADDVHSQPLTAGALLQQMSRVRSVDSLVADLNRNHTAIMIANAFEDSLLDPTPLAAFFDKLRTPKRLQLATGDHGGPELPGLLFDRPVPTITDAGKWLDHYLNHISNGIGGPDRVVLEDGATGASHSFTSWPAADRTLQLGTPGIGTSMTGSAATSWSRSVISGTDSGVSTPVPQIYTSDRYQPSTIAVGSIRTAHAYIWSGAPTAGSELVTGTPALRFTVSSSAPHVTLYAYLYDVQPSGRATLMTYAPATVSSGAASMTLRPLCWTVAGGHHLMLVVDTVDKRYASAEPAGTAISLSSPASLSLAVR
jgi:putative CocE/NonD family hydrolase